jgi:RibD C-terminal domain
MRRIRYSVAMSLDGFIAGPDGTADWIVMDPDIDFGALFAEFDTLLIGRKTFEDGEGRESVGAGDDDRGFLDHLAGGRLSGGHDRLGRSRGSGIEFAGCQGQRYLVVWRRRIVSKSSGERTRRYGGIGRDASASRRGNSSAAAGREASELEIRKPARLQQERNRETDVRREVAARIAWSNSEYPRESAPHLS